MVDLPIQQPKRSVNLVSSSKMLDLTNQPLRPGYWVDEFNNDAAETDPTAGWPGIEFWEGILGVPPFEEKRVWKFPTRFKATHSSLIPKGKHQGRLLLWDTTPIIARVPSLDNNEWWSWQAVVILDPSPTATIRSRNYIIPIGRLNDLPAGASTGYVSWFCAGHCWTEHGDLVIAGGNKWTGLNMTFGSYNGLWAWNPSTPTGSVNLYYFGQEKFTWANTGTHYDDIGAFTQAANLAAFRWYPTVKSTQKFAEAPYNGTKTGILVMGGTANFTGNDPAQNASWNNYEAYVVDAEVTSDDAGLSPDGRQPGGIGVGFIRLFLGPGITPNPTFEQAWQEQFIYYPHVHLLSNGGMFMAGMAPKSATLTNHGAQAGAWTRTEGNDSVAGLWNKPRFYGMSFLVPNHDGVKDRVVRIGGDQLFEDPPGSNELRTTGTCDIINASTLNEQWQAAPSLNLPRSEANVVLTPDADAYLFGGTERVFQLDPFAEFGVFHTKPELLTHANSSMGDSWRVLEWSPQDAYRNYHSTATLLADGRIFSGGGDASATAISADHPSHVHNPTSSSQDGVDYEFFAPRYLRPSADILAVLRRPTIVSMSPTPDADGTYPLQPNQTYTVTCGPLGQYQQLSHVVLMAPGSCTHHYDFNMRYYKPPTQSLNGLVFSFDTPASTAELPPGYYMLFVLDAANTPSEAVWVRI